MSQAGWKSAAMMVSWPRHHSVRSTASAPTATPTEIDNCWPTATSEVARLMRRLSAIVLADMRKHGGGQLGVESIIDRNRALACIGIA